MLSTYLKFRCILLDSDCIGEVLVDGGSYLLKK